MVMHELQHGSSEILEQFSITMLVSSFYNRLDWIRRLNQNCEEKKYEQKNCEEKNGHTKLHRKRLADIL